MSDRPASWDGPPGQPCGCPNLAGDCDGEHAEPLPDDAITAAQEAITRVLAEDWHETWIESDSALARAALEAAAPALRAQGAATVLERVRQFRDKHNPELNHVCCVSDLLYELLDGAQ